MVRAIYGSRVPVISGVGHETDTTLSDLVADQRAPTPSAAAELAVPDATQLQHQVVSHQRTVLNVINLLLAQRQQDVESCTQRLTGRAPQVDVLRQRVDDLAQGVGRLLAAHMALSKERLAGLRQRLHALNPQAVLGRGYAVVERADDATPVTQAAQVRQDDPLKITVSKGSFGARVV